MHGVGSSVVNALSEWLEVEVTQNGHVYSQKFERGKPVNDLHIIADKDGHGTTIRFKADAESFRKQRFMIMKFLQGDFVSRHFLMQGFQSLLQIKEEMKTAVKNFAMRAVFALS